MRVNRFIAAEGRFSTDAFRHCLSRCWGTTTGSESSACVQSDVFIL